MILPIRVFSDLVTSNAMPGSKGMLGEARSCVFCGSTDGLTKEHVFGDWLSRIGLDLAPVVYRAGPLNRIGRDLGVPRAPFRQTVRDVCGRCNGGWMSRLEDIAKIILTPLILGDSGFIQPPDQGAIAAWVQKTALVAMLVSTEDERAHGYGLPLSEYREMFAHREALEPLPATKIWIGRYNGQVHRNSVRVVPQVVIQRGSRDPDVPQGYAMTVVLGELLLHGVRITAPGLQLNLSTPHDLQDLWPANGRISWPADTHVDDASFLGLSKGKELRMSDPHVEIHPWKVATDLADSNAVGSMVELPVICGKHVVYYPSILVEEAIRGRFYVFMTSCECRKAYLVQTEADGAHCKAAGTPESIGELYEGLPGGEYQYKDEYGSFFYKAINMP